MIWLLLMSPIILEMEALAKMTYPREEKIDTAV